MSEYRETRSVVEEVPIRRARPVPETQYESVIHESRGLSGGAVVALVLAGIAAAVVITLMIVDSRERSNEDQLALERERMAAAQQQQQQPSSPPPQQPLIVVPPSQPPPAQVPVPAPAPSSSTPSTAPTSAEIELDITSKLLDDQDLRSQSVDVKFSGGTAVLSGRVSTEELKTRAEQITRRIKGVRSVINNISVQSN